jgi:hypothetical protein
MSLELAQKYAEFKIPAELKERMKVGFGFGSRKFTKMMLFANEVELTNDNIDYYMNCVPRRMEDESYDNMQLRTRFANDLLKYRAQLYDYSIYENK